jgi:hypothetical protein
MSNVNVINVVSVNQGGHSKNLSINNSGSYTKIGTSGMGLRAGESTASLTKTRDKLTNSINSSGSSLLKLTKNSGNSMSTSSLLRQYKQMNNSSTSRGGSLVKLSSIGSTSTNMSQHKRTGSSVSSSSKVSNY